jgi:hypothetical protein
MILRSILLFFLFFSLSLLHAQDAVRLSAEFSIKQKDQTGKGQLVTGTVYFDKKIQKICYKVDYPEPAFWLVKDSMFYEFNADTQFVKLSTAPYSPAFSIYQTILTDNFDDLGLKAMGFKIGSVEKVDTMVITEWLPDNNLKKHLGRVLLSHSSRKINAAVFFDAQGSIISKEQYKKIQLIQDQWIPTEIVSVSYKKEQVETIKITSLRNIQFNETTHNNFYDFAVPVLDALPK